MTTNVKPAGMNQVIAFTKGARIHIQAQPNVHYKFVDDVSGKTPEDAEAHRQGNDLIIVSKENDAVAIVENFWSECAPGNQCYAVVDLPNAMGETVITQDGPVIDSLLAGQIGQLSEGAAATAAGLGASVVTGTGSFLPFGLMALLGGSILAGQYIADNDDDDDNDRHPGHPFPQPTPDKTPPAKPGVEINDGKVEVTTEPDATVVVKDKDGNKIGEGTADEHGKASITPTTPMTPGSKITVEVTDQAGNMTPSKPIDVPNPGSAHPLAPEIDKVEFLHKGGEPIQVDQFTNDSQAKVKVTLNRELGENEQLQLEITKFTLDPNDKTNRVHVGKGVTRVIYLDQSKLADLNEITTQEGDGYAFGKNLARLLELKDESGKLVEQLDQTFGSEYAVKATIVKKGTDHSIANSKDNSFVLDNVLEQPAIDKVDAGGDKIKSISFNGEAGASYKLTITNKGDPNEKFSKTVTAEHDGKVVLPIEDKDPTKNFDWLLKQQDQYEPLLKVTDIAGNEKTTKLTLMPRITNTTLTTEMGPEYSKIHNLRPAISNKEGTDDTHLKMSDNPDVGDFLVVYGNISGDGISPKTNLSTGAGDDVVYGSQNLTAADGPVNIDLGNGNDTLIIKEKILAAGKKTINMGAGDDIVKIGVDVGATTINLGSGNNYLYVGSKGQGSGFVSQGSTITAGGGNDTVLIGTNIDYGSKVELGGGDNVMIVGFNKKIDGYIGGGSQITFGNGNDALTTESYLSDTTIHTGGGNDTLNIGGQIKNSTIDMVSRTPNVGSGNNKIFATEFSNNTQIDFGEGNDLIQTSGSINQSKIKFGAGDDRLFAKDIGSNSDIDMGDGNDFVQVQELSGKGLNTINKINLGSGNDALKVTLSSGGNIVPKNNTIDFGDGYDQFILSESKSADNNTFDLSSVKNLEHFVDLSGKKVDVQVESRDLAPSAGGVGKFFIDGGSQTKVSWKGDFQKQSGKYQGSEAEGGTEGVTYDVYRDAGTGSFLYVEDKITNFGIL